MENLYVTSEITLNKTAEKRSSPIPTNTEFFSYDQRVAKKTINFQFKGEPLDLSEANVILGFDFVTAGQSVILESDDGSIKIEDPTAGKVNVMLPNDIYAYSGSVIIYVFVEFSNGQSLDYPAFSTEFQESWIDQDLEEMAQFYVKRFEDLRNLVLEQAAGIDHDLTEFEDRIQNIESAIDSFDVDDLAKEIALDLERKVLDQLQQMSEQLEEAQQQLKELKSGLTISEAWAWSKDGTDRLTTVYPRENIAVWPEGGFSQHTLNSYGIWQATWSNDYRTLHLRAHNAGNLNGNLARYRYRNANNEVVTPERPAWRYYQGRMLLDGEPFKREYFQTTASNPIPRLNSNRSNVTRFLKFEIDEDGYFEACEGIAVTNGDMFNISLSLAHSEMIGRTITFEQLKIEDILVPESQTLTNFLGPVEKSIYTPRTWVDSLNAIPPYHAFAIYPFEDPTLYTRFELTKEAVRLKEQQQNEKMNQLAQRITDLGG
ncbi:MULTISPECIES: BppU family phage baseplate upper protein [unclassified Enterococcus]|uniref:BppU family phage baseplate upper protein n=1 Tax=unclassified Enterococcus TaxID=2608891 RepID=UPI001F330593|nr:MULTISPECIES: BppU family phage baseplate upper protein [unclassified Enterococcus]